MTASAKYRLHGKAAQLYDRINEIDPQNDSIERVESACSSEAFPRVLCHMLMIFLRRRDIMVLLELVASEIRLHKWIGEHR